MYIIGGFIAWLMTTCLGEMSAAMPVSGSLQAYSTEFVSPAMGFTIGWVNWIGGAMTITAQVVASAIIMRDIIPNSKVWVWIVLFSLLLFGVNMLDAKIFGTISFWCSSIKIIMIVAFIIVGAAMMGGIGTDQAVGFSNFSHGAFPTGIAGMAAVMMFSPLFLLSEIRVSETVNYTEDDVIRVSGIIKGENAIKYLGGSIQHLLFFRMGKAERQVVNLPWIKTAEIRFVFPGTANISLIEREAIAWIKHMGNYLLIDEEGFVMKVSTTLSDQYPEIRGVPLDRFTIGKKIETKEPENINWMVKLLQSLDAVDAGKQQKLIEVLDWVDFLDEREIYISMDKRITGKIKLDDDITYRLSYLKELYYNYIKPEERGMIDFFDEKYARFIAE